MNVDIVLLHLLRHKMPMTTVLSAKKSERESANGYMTDSLGGWPRTQLASETELEALRATNGS